MAWWKKFLPDETNKYSIAAMIENTVVILKMDYMKKKLSGVVTYRL
jgi:hypothetical protein